MASIVLAARVVLAAVFVTAGVAKLLDRHGTREALQGFGVPAWAHSPGVVILPLAELATAAALIPEPTARWGGLAALLLLTAFVGGIANALARDKAPDCHCFGQLHSAPAGRGTLVRNVVLAAPAALVVLEGPGPSITSWVEARTSTELVSTAGGIASLLLGAVAFALWRQNHTLRRDLGEARSQLELFPPGLPIDSPAPGFALGGINGEVVTLDALRARGKPIALVFVSPDCGPCGVLFPELARWQSVLTSQISLAVISHGTAAENEEVAAQSPEEILLQDDREAMRAYRIAGTPSAVIVTPEGKVASAPAVGAFQIESLLRLTLRHRAESPPPPRLPSVQRVGAGTDGSASA